jgi:hypothetical protein
VWNWVGLARVALLRLQLVWMQKEGCLNHMHRAVVHYGWTMGWGGPVATHADSVRPHVTVLHCATVAAQAVRKLCRNHQQHQQHQQQQQPTLWPVRTLDSCCVVKHALSSMSQRVLLCSVLQGLVLCSLKYLPVPGAVSFASPYSRAPSLSSTPVVSCLVLLCGAAKESV